MRATQSRKLVAFISGIPMKLRVRENVLDSAEVNFICVHKRLRSKRMAPVLIREVTRRVNLEGIWQAIYTAGVVLPKPVSTCRYFHRALDWQKLYEIGFSPLPANSKPSYQVMKYKLPEKTLVKGLREMKEKDIPAVSKLLHQYMKRYDLAPVYDDTEMKHWFLDTSEAGDERVVYSYVVEVCCVHVAHTVQADENRTAAKVILFAHRTMTRRSPTSSPSTYFRPRS